VASALIDAMAAGLIEGAATPRTVDGVLDQIRALAHAVRQARQQKVPA
jgi:tryptophan synthase alpha chain